MIKLMNWSVSIPENGWECVAPELRPPRLNGNVYGHPLFPDGSSVTTSSIKRVKDCDTYKEVKTRNTVYTLFPQDVDPEYEKQYPGAFERLVIKN